MLQIKAKNKLVSKIDPAIHAYVLGIATDTKNKQTYVEVRWNFEDDTMCYCFGMSSWKDGFTFLHDKYVVIG